MCLFAVTASADGLYEEALENAGFEQIEQALPDTVKELFEKFEIDAYNSNFISEFSSDTVFSIIGEFLNGGINDIKISLSTNIAILILWAVFETFSHSLSSDSGVNTVFSVILTLGITVPVLKLITSVSAAVKSGGTFMLAFIPVFFGITAVGGNAATAAGGSTVMLFAAEATVQIIAFITVPIASAGLALAISGALGDISPALKISLALKKATNYVLTLAFTVFLGFLSVQTAINSAADSVSLKTVKFMVGSFIPVAGSALSETVSALSGCIKMLQSGVGCYGIAVVAITVMPVAIQLVLWRLIFFAEKIAAEMFGLDIAVKSINAVDSISALLLGVVLFVGALFIIALAILLKAGGI